MPFLFVQIMRLVGLAMFSLARVAAIVGMFIGRLFFSAHEFLARFSRPRWLLGAAMMVLSGPHFWGAVRVISLGYADPKSTLDLFVGAACMTLGYMAFAYGLLWTAAEKDFKVGREPSSVSLRRERSPAEEYVMVALFAPRYLIWAMAEMLRAASSLPRAARPRATRLRKAVERTRSAGAVVALGATSDESVVALTAEELVRHTLILGATGSGKTTSLRRVLLDAIDADRAAVLIDLKGDPALIAELEATALNQGVPFRAFSTTPGHRCDHWNPLETGDPTTRRDKLIALSDWSEPYYRTICERFAQLAFAAYDGAEVTPSIEALVRLLDHPDRLRSLVRECPTELAWMHEYISDVTEDRQQRSALSGFAARIGTLVDPGGALHVARMNTNRLDLDELMSQRGIAVFSLNSSRGRASAAQVAALALLDVMTVVGNRIASTDSKPAIVAVDEFSAIDGDHVLGLLARARSAGVGVILSTQEFADLTRIDDGFADQVIGNTGTKIIHRQDVPDSAELAARLLGTRQVDKQTFRMDITGTEALLGNTATGDVSHRAVEEFLVHPNAIKTLRTGTALVIQKEPEFRWAVAEIDAPRSPRYRPTSQVNEILQQAVAKLPEETNVPQAAAHSETKPSVEDTPTRDEQSPFETDDRASQWPSSSILESLDDDAEEAA